MNYKGIANNTFAGTTFGSRVIKTSLELKRTPLTFSPTLRTISAYPSVCIPKVAPQDGNFTTSASQAALETTITGATIAKLGMQESGNGGMENQALKDDKGLQQTTFTKKDGNSGMYIVSDNYEKNIENDNIDSISRDQKRPTYPFTAIVGQEEMKLALLLNVIDPKIGGVMIMGDRGTGKSTTVRALVDLLPTIKVVDNDPFNSHPSDAELMSQNVREQVLQGTSLTVVEKKTTMIDLPLGATEDRVCGTIDIEKALSEGVKAFEPGLLAKANRGILYVDEVNLLDDHLVDILLDSAASGWNTVEREGISISHPARFILVGSGNPEEGELRPQLLDRFGMHAQIGTVREADLRVKIVEERANFDKSPVDFLKMHYEKQKELADKIVAARHLLGAVKIDYDLRVKISQVCGQLNVDGLRGDIVTNRASQALAAFEARTNVTPQDIFRVIPLCLRHRLRKDPLEPIDSGNRVREIFKQVFGFVAE